MPSIRRWLAGALSCLALALIPGKSAQAAESSRGGQLVTIMVDAGKDLGPLKHFWQATGFTPASMLLQSDQRQQTTYAGSIARGGITHVRIHVLLDLGRATTNTTTTGGGKFTYHWDRLDKGLDVLLRNGQKPFFELMGRPTKYFQDFSDMEVAREWQAMVSDLARHLIQRYGQEEVRSWYFETWNEPDGRYFGGPNPKDVPLGWGTGREIADREPNVKAFLRYYDACQAGLRAVDPQLKMGGIGGMSSVSPLFKAFLAHCASGKNELDGQPASLDFISVHEKGGKAPINRIPDTQSIMDDTMALVNYVREQHPNLKDKPFINDECDPVFGWGKPLPWYGGPYYAAWAVHTILRHQEEIIDAEKVNYVLLSNDNGFVGNWDQRTLCAKFGSGNKRQSEEQFYMLKKPVFSAMELLAQLGDTRVKSRVKGTEGGKVRALAARLGEEQLAVLVANFTDYTSDTARDAIELNLKGLPEGREAMMAHYRIDSVHTNPQALWRQMGSPEQPTLAQIQKLQAAMEPQLTEAPQPVRTANGKLQLQFELERPGVSLIVLSAKPAAAPARVAKARLEGFTGLRGEAQQMVVWDEVTERPLKTYEVLAGPSAQGPWKRLNPADLISTAWLDLAPGGPDKAFYAVRAVDLWGRAGEPSAPIPAPR